MSQLQENNESLWKSACRYGNLKKVKILLENGVDVNKYTSDGKTPLILASENGRPEIVKILLKNGADINKCSKSGKTPLVYASEKLNFEIVRILNKYTEKYNNFFRLNHKNIDNTIKIYEILIDKIKEKELVKQIIKMKNDIEQNNFYEIYENSLEN